MKKYIIWIFFFLCATSVSAQSVLGIPLGSSYQTVKECLENRFGTFKVIEEGGKLTVMNPVIGNFDFKLAEFYFQMQGDLSWLSQVFVQTWFWPSEQKAAKYMRDSLAEILKEKYEVDERIGENGFKIYFFGENPKNKNNYLGDLAIIKDRGSDGKQRLYVTLNYGPVYYIQKNSDF